MKNCNLTNQAGKSTTIFAALLLFLITGSLLLRAIIFIPDDPVHATVLPIPRLLPEFTLTSQDGSQFTRESFDGQWSLLFFGFTNCPDICPVTLQQLAMSRLRMIEADPDSKLPEIVFVSVDPDRDSNDKLRQYTKSFGSNVTGISGDPVELSKLTGALGIYFNVSGADSDNYLVEHSAAVIVINDDAEFHALFSAPHSIDAFASDIPRIVALK